MEMDNVEWSNMTDTGQHYGLNLIMLSHNAKTFLPYSG